jgi:N-acetylmuramoyl-L-alanine amidase
VGNQDGGVQMRVAISAGHHPRSQGARHEGMTEYALSKVWIAELHLHLAGLGIDTYVVPSTTLRKKVEFINRKKLDCCLEIHFNDHWNKKISGVETLYCPNSLRGHIFALTVHNWYAVTMSNPDRGIKEGWYKMEGLRIDYFLRYTNCPALILEPDFIAQYAAFDTKRVATCRAIARGILKFLNEDD